MLFCDVHAQPEAASKGGGGGGGLTEKFITTS